MEKKIPVDIKITPENKCGFCTNSKCCTYITEELATPRSMHDFDHMLWQFCLLYTSDAADERVRV